MSQDQIYLNQSQIQSSDYDIYEAITSFNFQYIISYIYNNYIQLILLICVFLIIYIVDRINQYNNQIFSLPQISGIPMPSQQISNITNTINKVNKINNKRKSNKK